MDNKVLLKDLVDRFKSIGMYADVTEDDKNRYNKLKVMKGFRIFTFNVIDNKIKIGNHNIILSSENLNTIVNLILKK